MDYIHINEKQSSGRVLRRGDILSVGNEKYRIIGLEIATNDFICVRVADFKQYIIT